jgi:hypothetical protein
MMQRSIWIRGAIVGATALSMLFVAVSSHAATRNMVGSMGAINPSVEPPFYFETGPAVFGKKVGPYAPIDGWKTLDVAGTTPGTFVGRAVTLPAGRMNFVGTQFRNFPAFPTVGNQTKTYTTTHQTGSFFVGGGALAACPGNGCTSAGAGTVISWCPPAAGEAAATPAPGTPGNQIGDWECASQQGAGAGAFPVRMAISNDPAANHFGGTFTMLRNMRNTVWRVLVQPGTDGIAEVQRNWQNLVAHTWTPGGPDNFAYQTNPANWGPRINAYLDAYGGVAETLGCVNPTGTVGGTFDGPNTPILGFGSNCGTPPPPATQPQGWGFKMTTGTLAGSDPWPFVGVTTTTPPGTAFAPNFNARTPGQGFFFTRMGTDKTTASTRRNIVLLGGGVIRDPGSGNLFFRILDLRLDMTVPEPAMGLGLVAGAAALAALARRRRS